MNLGNLVEEAGQRQFDEDNKALEDEDSKLGEGANTSAHFSPRGYVIKPIQYSKIQADNPCKSAENPHDHVKRVRDVERFPWAELEDVDAGNGSFDYARVKMEPWFMGHQDAAELYHISEVINQDLEMFFELIEEGIVYEDFKPGNIGYFQDDNLFDEGLPIAKAIDITDGPRKPWSEVEDLSNQRFSGIMDVYITGTHDEDGLVDIYPINAPEAEEHVINYLGIESNNITGDPYKDLVQVMSENQESVDHFLY